MAMTVVVVTVFDTCACKLGLSAFGEAELATQWNH